MIAKLRTLLAAVLEFLLSDRNKRRMVLILLLCLLCIPALAYAEMNDFEVAEALLTQKKPKLAYPLAAGYATELDNYEGYRAFVQKFPDAPQKPVMLTKAFDKAKGIHTEKVYDDFVGVAGKTPWSFLAITAEFSLFTAVDTISEYERFIQKYPNTPEAAAAMERIQQIAFERAQTEDQVIVYDQYVRNFPYAPQVGKVLELAKAAAQRDLEQELRTNTALGSLPERKELLARRIYNEGRQAEKRQETFLVERNYSLLETMFNDTKVFTEFLDRAEQLDYRKEMKQYQEQIIQSVNVVKQAVDDQTRQVHQAFALMQQEIQAVNASVQSVRAEVQEVGQTVQQGQNAIKVEVQEVGAAVQNTQAELRQTGTAINYLSGDIARAVNLQTTAIERARESAASEAARVRAANYALYQQDREENWRQNRRNLKCAEILAKNGKYGWFDDCP